MSDLKPGDPVWIRPYTLHAHAQQFWPHSGVEEVRHGRRGVVVRVMAGGQYVIVDADAYGQYTPAQQVRVRVDNLTRRQA